MAGCETCFFGGPKVGWKGDFESPFVIVGESPGSMELVKKMPFVGPSGELLDSVLKPLLPFMNGVTPFITNAINCLPRQKDPNRLAQACKACNHRLREEILAHPREVILGLGNAAMWSLTGDYNLKITKARGQVFASNLARKGVVAAVHPSYLLRGSGSLQQWQRDFAVAVKLLTGKDPIIEGAPLSSKMNAKGQFVQGKIYTLTTPEEVRNLARKLRDVKYFAGDVETDGFNPRTGKIVSPAEYEGKKLVVAEGVRCRGKGILSLGISYEKESAFVMQGHLITDDLFQGPGRQCWHNGKYDISWLVENGCPSAAVDDDTMLLSYLLNERGGFHDLEQVGADWLQAPNYKAMLDAHIPTKKHSYAYIPLDVLLKYQGIDTNLTFWLRETLHAAVMADPNLARVYNRLMIPGSYFVYMMERNGFKTDLQQVASNEIRLEEVATGYEKTFMAEAAKHGFPDINIRSPLQLTEYLWGKLKMPGIDKSTDADHLERVLEKASEGSIHQQVARNLLDYRKVFKQLSTYVIPARDKTDPTDGRMHTTFKLHGTTTGRLSSNKPNMQNIPRDPHIRGQFIAPIGRALVECDLAQAELRMLACLSKDEAMINIFNSGISLHDEVAEYLFGKGFNKEQKMIAKNVNFGIVYGISAAGLKDQIEINAHIQGSQITINMREAQGWIDGWFRRFPQAAKYIQDCRNAPMRKQNLVSFTGRKRRFGIVGHDNLHSLQNEAANFPHQSGAHDITMLTGIEVVDTLEEKYNTLLVNEVHDCLVNETPNDMGIIINVARLITSTMERIPKEWGLTLVPFKAEAEVGNRWGHLTKFDPWKYTDEEIVSLMGVPYETVITAQAH